MMMKHNEVLPTLNLETPGEGCEGLDYVMGSRPRSVPVSIVLKNSFAFGGINAALLCKKMDR